MFDACNKHIIFSIFHTTLKHKDFTKKRGGGGVHDTQSKHQRFVSYHIRREYQRGKLRQCVLSVTLKTCAPAAICYAGLARGMNHKKHKGQKSDLCLLKVLQFLTVIVAHLTGGPHPLQRRECVLCLSGHVAKSTHVHLVGGGRGGERGVIPFATLKGRRCAFSSVYYCWSSRRGRLLPRTQWSR